MTFLGRFRSKQLRRIGLFLSLPVFAFVLIQADWLHRWDLLIYDWFLAAWSREPADDIVIVAIDEQSLRDLGRWPWSRHLHARLVRKLSAAGVKGIALDIVFAEPDMNDPAADIELTAALTASGRVVLPVFPEQNRAGGQLMETLPIPALAKAAASIGHVDVELDSDGIVRGAYLKAGLGSPYWPTLALALLETVDPGAWQVLPGQRPAQTHASSPYVWRRDYRVLVPFAGPPGHFRHYSYGAVLNDTVSTMLFRNKYVLVGATASGMDDALPTPVSGSARLMSGVEFNANVLDSLQRGLTIQPMGSTGTLVLTEALVLLSLVLYAVFPPRWTPPLAGLGVLATLIGSVVLLHEFHCWFPPAAALLVQGLSYPLWGWERLLHAIRSLFEKEELARATLRSIGDAVIVTDPEGVVQYLNPVAESMLGGSSIAMRGQPLGTIVRVTEDRDRQSPVDWVALCLEKAQSIVLSEPNTLVNRADLEYAVRVSIAPMWDPQGRISGVVVALGDITEKRRMTERMAFQATHDALTNLPNQGLLQDRLGHAIARAGRDDHNLAVLYIGLDHFKKVNESLGRTAGDTLLREVVARLLVQGRKEDTLARVGGDEFVYLLEGVRQVEKVADLARRILQVLESPFRVVGHECFITASVGISLFPKDGKEAENLLKSAETAMYRAKDKGRDNFQIYAHDMHVRALERLKLEQYLRYAMARQELELYYQPQVDLTEHRIVGVEALLRWRHPERGLVSPMEFVPLAEETGLIETIGEWALRAACQQAKVWQCQGLPALRVAVNMSPRQFLRSDMADIVARILFETGLEPQHLELEITESLLMKDVESGIATMHALKAIGVRLSIDDFGTGYSSLNYLKQFPIDQLKIDKSFLRGIETNRDDLAITLAVISMAHGMGLTVIAEGVENEMQLAFLRANRCDEIQGYHISRPVPAHEISALLQKDLS